MKKNDIALKSCPFCGDERLIKKTERGFFWIQCSKCHADGPKKASEEQAIYSWNKAKLINTRLNSKSI